jgi:hypothetical protein
MSINRSRRFGEYFQIWPGAPDNQVEVLSADASFLQLVLRVNEPRRRYVEVIRKGWRASPESVEAHARSGGGRILKETRYDWRVEMWTPSVDRRYLLKPASERGSGHREVLSANGLGVVTPAAWCNGSIRASKARGPRFESWRCRQHGRYEPTARKSGVF